ncbi:MAG: HD domain-containing protein [Elusimicrobia bacterium]|nr:HD domain-containing protein [Elusimicrobiota bacterium]
MKQCAGRKAEQDRYAQAFYFALRAHESQFRKGTGRPYIEHPVRVAALLLELHAEPELVVAGFLHDVVEDTGCGVPEIKAIFGQRAAALVAAVSENKTLSWEERKRAAVEFLKKAPLAAVVLEFADKLDNIRSIKSDHERSGEEVWKRFQRPRDSQDWYYRAMLAVFSSRLRKKEYKPYVREMKTLVEALFG